MHDVWISSMMISGNKSVIDVSGIIIIGLIYDYDECHSEQKKVLKIINWSISKCTKNARAFIGIVVYYHIFITDFAIITISYFYIISERICDLIEL